MGVILLKLAKNLIKIVRKKRSAYCTPGTLKAESTINFKTLESECIRLIQHSKIDEAYKKICQRNLNSKYPVGIGVDWENELTTGLSKARLDDMLKLLNQERSILPDDFGGNTRLFNATSIYYILSGDKYHHGAEANTIFRADYTRIATKRQLNNYDAGGIEYYTFLATLDLSTCPMCAKLDMKRFPVAEAKTGVNLPPMHNGCRCTTMPDVDMATLAKIRRAARDPVTGKSITVPGDWDYTRWHAEYVESNPDAIERERHLHSEEFKEKQIQWAIRAERIRKKEAQFYIDAESRIMKIVRENPGILQKDLTSMFGADLHSASAYVLNKLAKAGHIKKIKSGRTFSLYVKESLSQGLFSDSLDNNL